MLKYNLSETLRQQESIKLTVSRFLMLSADILSALLRTGLSSVCFNLSAIDATCGIRNALIT